MLFFSMYNTFYKPDIDPGTLNFQYLEVKHSPKLTMVKNSATVKTQRFLSTWNISWNDVDQNGGFQKRDLWLITAVG